jgi:hypothetical protein
VFGTLLASTMLISILPLLLVCGAVLWHARQFRKSMTAADGRSVAQVFADIADEMKQGSNRHAEI